MLSTPDVRATFAAMAPLMPPESARFSTAFFEAAGDPDAERTLRAFVTRASLARDWAEFQDAWPLILAPIGTEPPFLAGTDLEDGRVADTIRQMRMAMAVNALGLPAVAVPVGVGDGLPQVVQLIAGRSREDLCLDAAETVERAVGVLTPIDPRVERRP
jgi:amidase